MDCHTLGFPSFTISLSVFKLMSVESVMPSNHLILCCHPIISSSVAHFFSCPKSFPASGSFPMSWPKYWSFSFSINPSNEYSGLVSSRIYWLESPCSPRDSQESSAPQFKGIYSLVHSLLYGPTLTSVHDYWKNRCFDYTDLCQKSNVFAF